MADTKVTKRLTTIVSADVAGYSRLMEADEVGTLAALMAHREATDRKIEAFGGRIVGTAGDGMLVEFPSVSDAVSCALEVQSMMAERNADLPADKRMEFRIGINLGDVMIDGDDIFGTGVNVASRLQELAEPGGICVSASVRDSVHNLAGLAFEDQGEKRLKNIERAVGVCRVLTGSTSPRTPARPLPQLERPDRCSVVVLPFVNLSNDPAEDYFSDGITEDLITELSKYRELFVIARNSSFAYKGRAVKAQTVGNELGVQYIVHGSVRRAAERVRINAQIVNAAAGNQVWAERFDRDLTDVFAVQDEITYQLVARVPRELEAADLDRAKRKPPETMAAYDYLLRGKDHYHRNTKSDNEQSLEYLTQATRMDPNFAQAWAWKACALGQSWLFGYREQSPDLWKEGQDTIGRALELDSTDAEVHRIVCEIELIQRNYERAQMHHDRAINTNPNDPRMLYQHGYVLLWLGQAADGVEWFETAMRRDPHYPDWLPAGLGHAHFAAHRYHDAITAFGHLSSLGHVEHAFLAACHAKLGASAKAKQHVERVLEIAPDFRVASYVGHLPYKNPADAEHHKAALVKAGLPP